MYVYLIKAACQSAGPPSAAHRWQNPAVDLCQILKYKDDPRTDLNIPNGRRPIT